MEKRLLIAKELLSEKGVIFIQISDIEVAQLKCLCDDIFGESNFLNIISVNMKNIAGASGGGEDKRFKKNCEYILVYAKSYDFLPLFNGAYTYTEMSSVVEQYRVACRQLVMKIFVVYGHLALIAHYLIRGKGEFVTVGKGYLAVLEHSYSVFGTLGIKHYRNRKRQLLAHLFAQKIPILGITQGDDQPSGVF